MAIHPLTKDNATILAAKSRPWLLESHLETIMLASIILEAMTGGILFIFSNTIMKTFASFDDEVGINLMNKLNIIIFNPLLLSIGFGGLISAYPAIHMMTRPNIFPKPARYYALASVLVFLFGQALITGTQSIPRNDALLVVDPASEEGILYWREDYLGDWVAWNTARTIFSVIASILGGLSLVAMRN